MELKKDLIALKTIAKKEIDRILRIWIQTLVPPTITITLYFLIFGKLIGSQVSDISGYTYIQYIVPGLIMMSIITNSYMNVSSSFFGSKFQKSIEELLISPASNYIIIIGFVIGGMFRSLIVGTLVLCISFLFTEMTIQNIFIILIFAIFTSIIFSLGGLFNGIFAKKFDDVSLIPTFVLTPLTYLGGVFYSIDMLPELFQTISKLNPIIYMINGFRYGFLGISDINIFTAFIMMILFTILLFSLNLHMLKKGINLKN